MTKTCAHDTCPKPVRAAGLCSTHYNQTRGPRHPKIDVPCGTCSKVVNVQRDSRRPVRFCSLRCRDLWAKTHKVGAYRERTPTPKPARPRYDPRGPLLRALDEGDAPGVIEALRTNTTLTPTGCWIWQRSSHKGYPTVTIRGKYTQVHRLVIETTLGAPLGAQAAHHTCATTMCINPEHLQPVTHVANTAEMLARSYMTSRIRDLEQALAAIDPHHALLNEVGLSDTA